MVLVAALAGCRRERDILGNPVDGSHRVSTIAVLDGGARTLWKISAPPPGIRSAENLVYGEAPAGFTQEIPAAAVKPRPLVQDEKLIVVIVTREYVYRGECRGNGLEPRCERWDSARPDSRAVERALRGETLGTR